MGRYSTALCGLEVRRHSNDRPKLITQNLRGQLSACCRYDDAVVDGQTGYAVLGCKCLHGPYNHFPPQVLKVPPVESTIRPTRQQRQALEDRITSFANGECFHKT